MATQVLRFTDDEFWRMTMRKLDILLNRHLKFMKPPTTNNITANVSNKSERRRIGKNERAYIDELDI